MKEVKTQYEENQSFNFLTRFFHGIRYTKMIKLLKEIGIDDAKPVRILDIGCAHAKLFGVLNQWFNIDYTGLDKDKEFIAAASERYGRKSNFSLIEGSVAERLEVI